MSMEHKNLNLPWSSSRLTGWFNRVLPRYRGAAPIQWAILNDETETGVTIMKMDAGLDTGDILAQASTPILATDNSQTLHDRLARLGGDLLARTIREHVAGKLTPRAQPTEGATNR